MFAIPSILSLAYPMITHHPMITHSHSPWLLNNGHGYCQECIMHEVDIKCIISRDDNQTDFVAYLENAQSAPFSMYIIY